jgi:hypothetical protein
VSLKMWHITNKDLHPRGENKKDGLVTLEM